MAAGTGQAEEHALAGEGGKPETLGGVTAYTGRTHEILGFFFPLNELHGLLLYLGRVRSRGG